MRVAVFIDNSNVFKNIRKLKSADNQWETFYDPYKFAEKIAGDRELVSVNFYCVRPPVYLLNEDEAHRKKYILTERYYSAIEKLQKTEVKYGDLRGVKGELIEKNVDTQLATDVVALAALNKFDVAIIISNDGDFVSAIENIKKFGKKTEVVFFKGSLSMNLKRVSDITRRARRSYFEKLDFDREISDEKKE